MDSGLRVDCTIVAYWRNAVPRHLGGEASGETRGREGRTLKAANC